jgi:thiosulfate dehydrogenase [quinone] large subunit
VFCERYGETVCCDVSSESAVYITWFGIAIGEAVIGTLFVFGLFLRPTLVIGILLMLLLIFGSTLIEQWEIVSVPLITVAFYVGLLAL